MLQSRNHRSKTPAPSLFVPVALLSLVVLLQGKAAMLPPAGSEEEEDSDHGAHGEVVEEMGGAAAPAKGK